ncbi:MAG TPA: NAD(P)H-dependent glycerol-3-phosphate dehydrogenase [Burkholderiales bacterium]|nr:NAD(P)H-dependent glycerol-3-phosphate dehydrogenase [Burkholderiales bacterium]
MLGMARVGIIGGGAFGTAMACVISRSRHEVVMWAREPEVVAAINEERMNRFFLAGARIPPGIRATGALRAAAEGADFLLLAPPAQHMRSVTVQLAPFVKPGTPVVSCSKGMERGSLALMPEVLAETLPQARVAVLSGPSFAREIASDLPCGVTLACADMALATSLAGEIASPSFCVHPSDDVIGAALGGVMKNVIAIASGIAAGRKLGENARATLVTLGLDESIRLGRAKGARRETFLGFSGAGDLMLTANSLQSRNTSLGVALGEGRRLAEVLAERKEVTEGAFSAEAVVALARRLGVPMPISEAVDAMLNHGAALDATIARLVASCPLSLELHPGFSGASDKR